MLGRVLLTTPSGQYKQNNQGCGQSAIGQAKQAKTLLSGKGFAQNLQIDPCSNAFTRLLSYLSVGLKNCSGK